MKEIRVYKFHWYCGRMGSLSSVFIAPTDVVEDALGKEVYFGEVLGKHSEIHGILEENDLKSKPITNEQIHLLLDVLDDLNTEQVDEVIQGLLNGTKRSYTINGRNPLNYLPDAEEED